ncbi:hypothetical protein ACNHUS_34810 [Actinomycetes bacterium M1A6_2h]
MGIFRKVTSVSTAGLVDLRSDKERIARSARKSSNEVKKQTKLMRENNSLLRAQTNASTESVDSPKSIDIPIDVTAGPSKNATAGWRLNTDDEARPHFALA